MAQTPITNWFLYNNAIPYIGEQDADGTKVVPGLQYVKNAAGKFVPVSASDPVPMSVTGRNVSDGNPASVTASMEKDANGDGIQRVHEAAPVAYDQANDARKSSIVRREPITVQTHSSVTVAGSNGTNSSSWQDASGCDQVSVLAKTDANVAPTVRLDWADASTPNVIAAETLTLTPIGNYGNGYGVAGRTTRKGTWVRVTLINGDPSAHVMSSWTTLQP